MLEYSHEIRIMRGIAILLILFHHLLSHVEQTHNIVMLTYSLNHVHVVVFFVISGVLFQYKKNKIYNMSFVNFGKDKGKRLLIPYFFWSLVLAMGIKIVCQFQNGLALITKLGYTEWSIPEIVWNTLTMNNYYTAHLWFVYVLFFVYFVHYLFKDSICNWKAFALIFAIINIIFIIFHPPFLIERFLRHFCNFLFGRLFFKYRYWDVSLKKVMTLISLMVVLILETFEYFNLNSLSYSYIGNFLWGIAGTQIVFKIAYTMVNKIGKIGNYLATIGDASYPIYLVHNPYIVSGLYVVLKIVNTSYINDLLYIVLGIILSVLIPRLLYDIILKRNRKISFIFGI